MVEMWDGDDNVFAVCTVLTIGYLGYRWLEHKRVQRLTGIKSGRLGLPLLGTTLEIGAARNHVFKQAAYGPISYHYAMGQYTVAISDEKAAMVVLRSPVFISKWPKPFADLFGEHATIMLNGDIHKKNREMILRTLGPTWMREYTKMFVSIFMNSLEAASQTGQFVDGFNVATDAVWEAMATVLLGENATPEAHKVCKENFHVYARGFNSIPINLPFTEYGKALASKAVLEVETAKQAHRHVEELKCGVNMDDNCLLRKFVIATNEILGDVPDDFIANNLGFILVAAIDTTVSQFCVVMDTLVDHPECVERIRADTKAQLNGRSISEITYDDVSNLQYVHWFYREASRMRDTSAQTFRYCTKDFRLPGGELIPKGWNVQVLLSPMTRAYYSKFPDAETFRPERYADISIKGCAADTAFGYGRRQCPGMQLARLELHLITILVANMYDVERMVHPKLNKPNATSLKPSDPAYREYKPNGPTFVYQPLPRPDGGLFLKFSRRLIETI